MLGAVARRDHHGRSAIGRCSSCSTRAGCGSPSSSASRSATSTSMTRLLRAFGKGSKERLVPFGRPPRGALAAWLGRGGRPQFVPAQFARRSDAEALFLSARGRRMTRQARLDRRARGGRSGRARGQGHAARLSAQLRHAPPRSRRGRPRRPGAARPRLDHDDADLHQGLPGAPAPRLPSGASTGSCQARSRR